MGKYPFKIIIKDTEMQKVFIRLMTNRNSKIPTKNMSKQLGWKIKPIRSDIFIARDMTHNNDSIIGLKDPFLNMKQHKNTFIFNKTL